MQTGLVVKTFPFGKLSKAKPAAHWFWFKTFFKWQTRDLCTFRHRAVSCGFLPARKAFGTAARVSYFAETFLEQKMIRLLCLIPEMDSFPKRVAKNFCDQPLPKYLDPKTVLIYCPHPVDPHQNTGSGSVPGSI